MNYNNLCHVEYFVRDLDQAQAFYQGLFGWDFRSFGDDMRVFGQQGNHIGGLAKRDTVNPGESPSLWFQVQDLEATMARAVELGGQRASERSDVPGVGWSGVVADPDGNAVGLVQYADPTE